MRAIVLVVAAVALAGETQARDMSLGTKEECLLQAGYAAMGAIEAIRTVDLMRQRLETVPDDLSDQAAQIMDSIKESSAAVMRTRDLIIDLCDAYPAD